MSKPHGPSLKAIANGPHAHGPHAPAGPRVITLRARTPAQRAATVDAERAIRAREGAEHARRNARPTAYERREDINPRDRIDKFARAEHEMNERFRRAEVVGG